MTFNDEYRLLWADFPAEEYASRIARAQELMVAEDLDLVVLTSQENVEYFSGFLTAHWDSKAFPTAALVLHRSADPILVLPGFLAGTAFSTSPLTDLLTFDEPHAKPRQFADQLVTAVRRLGGSSPRIGFERGDSLLPRWNMDDYLHVMPQLVGAGEVASAANVIWGCRMIKTPLELERLTWLTGLTDRALAATFADLVPGKTEFAIGGEIATHMIAEGAEGTSFRNIRAGANRYHCSDSHPQHRPVVEGDLLVVDTGAKFNLYQTDVAYTVLFGQPTDRHRQLWDITTKAQDAAVAQCRPGVRVCDVFRAAAEIIETSGLPGLDMVGHSIGIDPHEPPMIDPYNTARLEAGMFLAVEPWLYDPSGLGIFALEEHILVTDDGPVTVSSLPRNELRVVA